MDGCPNRLLFMAALLTIPMVTVTGRAGGQDVTAHEVTLPAATPQDVTAQEVAEVAIDEVLTVWLPPGPWRVILDDEKIQEWSSPVEARSERWPESWSRRMAERSGWTLATQRESILCSDGFPSCRLEGGNALVGTSEALVMGDQARILVRVIYDIETTRAVLVRYDYLVELVRDADVWSVDETRPVTIGHFR